MLSKNKFWIVLIILAFFGRLSAEVYLIIYSSILNHMGFFI